MIEKEALLSSSEEKWKQITKPVSENQLTESQSEIISPYQIIITAILPQSHLFSNLYLNMIAAFQP